MTAMPTAVPIDQDEDWIQDVDTPSHDAHELSTVHKLPRAHAESTSFPPGCYVAYLQKPIAAGEEDVAVYDTGTVQSMSMDYAYGSSRELMHKIRVSKNHIIKTVGETKLRYAPNCPVIVRNDGIMADRPAHEMLSATIIHSDFKLREYSLRLKLEDQGYKDAHHISADRVRFRRPTKRQSELLLGFNTATAKIDKQPLKSLDNAVSLRESDCEPDLVGEPMNKKQKLAAPAPSTPPQNGDERPAGDISKLGVCVESNDSVLDQKCLADSLGAGETHDQSTMTNTVDSINDSHEAGVRPGSNAEQKKEERKLALPAPSASQKNDEHWRSGDKDSRDWIESGDIAIRGGLDKSLGANTVDSVDYSRKAGMRLGSDEEPMKKTQKVAPPDPLVSPGNGEKLPSGVQGKQESRVESARDLVPDKLAQCKGIRATDADSTNNCHGSNVKPRSELVKKLKWTPPASLMSKTSNEKQSLVHESKGVAPKEDSEAVVQAFPDHKRNLHQSYYRPSTTKFHCSVIGEDKLNSSHFVKTKKIPIPQWLLEGTNVIGMLLGTKGQTKEKVENESGCKIKIRGEGTGSTGKYSDRDKPHVSIKGPDQKSINSAADSIRNRLFWMVENDHSRDRLRYELAAAELSTRHGVGAVQGRSPYDSRHMVWMDVVDIPIEGGSPFVPSNKFIFDVKKKCNCDIHIHPPPIEECDPYVFVFADEKESVDKAIEMVKGEFVKFEMRQHALQHAGA